MESLALLVIAITLSFAFVATFVGFIVGDLTPSVPIAVVACLVPAFVVGFYTQNIFSTALWSISFVIGHVVGCWFRSKGS